MTKAVYRPSELEVITEKIRLDPPTSFRELAHLSVRKRKMMNLKLPKYIQVPLRKSFAVKLKL